MRPTFWISGLPGAGKTTVARMCESRLQASGHSVVVVDGDLWRTQRAAGDYSDRGRWENVQALANFCQTLNALGYTAIVATCSPAAALRYMASRQVKWFCEIELFASEKVCRSRQPELYAKADAGEFKHYPGVHVPFESRVEKGAAVIFAEQPVDAVADRVLEIMTAELELEEG